jgi:hypothetical protein
MDNFELWAFLFVPCNLPYLFPYACTEHVVQMLEGTVGEEGTADLARARVQAYFQQLRETLQLQEAAAMTAVDTHIRERLCSLRQLQEDLSTSLSQVTT